MRIPNLDQDPLRHCIRIHNPGIKIVSKALVKERKYTIEHNRHSAIVFKENKAMDFNGSISAL
jgi:hypothetical protein